MEVHLKPDVQAKLVRIASERGSDAPVLIGELVEQFVEHDAWFVEEVNQGLAAADRGELVDHDDVRKLFNDRYPG
jgi:predicted transcriptional regulator